jgi:hypothetical protein
MFLPWMTAILDLPLQVTLSNIVYYNYVRYVLKYPGVNSRAEPLPSPRVYERNGASPVA